MFDGIGAAAVVALVALLIRRFRRAPIPPTNNSAIVSPSGNQNVNAPTFNMNFGQSVPASPPPKGPESIADAKRALPNMVCTAWDVARVWQLSGAVLSDEESDGNAIMGFILRFTNEARKGNINVGGCVKAHLIYRDADTERHRVRGCWLNENDDAVKFNVDDVHSLLVGLVSDDTFGAAGKRHSSNIEVPLAFKEFHDFEEGTLDVRLTHADNGEVLYEGRFQLKTKPSSIAPLTL